MCLSTGPRCSLQRSLSRLFVSTTVLTVSGNADIVNKVFRVAVDTIMNGSYFPSGRKRINLYDRRSISDVIFAHRKDPLVALVCYQYVI